MTLAPDREESGSEESGREESPESSQRSPEVVRRVVRQRTVARRRRRKRLLVLQSLLTVVFVVAIAGLAFVGYRASLGITGGTGERIDDPAAPGYVAEVLPTSATLVVFDVYPWGRIETAGDVTGDVPAAEGRALLTSLLVVQRTGGQPATIVPLPDSTMLWAFDDSPPESAAVVFSSGGSDVLGLRFGASLTFGPTEVLTLRAEALIALGEAAGPITVDLPDDVLERNLDDPEQIDVRYPHGPLTLEPGDLPEFFAFRGERETVSNFALRTDLVWRALLEQLEPGQELTLGPAETMGDDVERFAELLEAAVQSQPQVTPVPYATSADGGHEPGAAEGIDTSAMPPWVAQHVPFPVSAFPGQRVKVELLNGTHDPDVLRALAPRIVEANGEISWTGNAESFDLATSRVEFSRPEARGAAEAIAASLGLTAQEHPDLETHAEVVVVVGSDQL